MIADSIEQGFGVKLTHSFVNLHQQDEGEPPIGESAIRNVILRLKPVIRKTPKIGQGSVKDSPWTVARKNFVAQVAIRFGVLEEENLEKLKDENGELPEHFQIESGELTPLNKDQVCWFDETHTKTVTGCETEFQAILMKEDSIHQRWILPQKNLNANTRYLSLIHI